MGFAIGIDIGGSLIKIGVVADSGEILARKEKHTPTLGSPEHILKELCDNALELIRELKIPLSQVVGVGLGMPGHINADGKSSSSSNVPILDHIPLVDLIQSYLHLPTYLDNDATLAALAEHRYGEHPKVERLLLMTIGSGIGAGLILRGTPYRMTRGCTGDPGHIIIDASLKWKCRIGCRGCLETVGSGQALIRNALSAAHWYPDSLLAKRAREKHGLTAFDVIELAREGDSLSLGLIEELAHWLALGLVSWCYFFDPDLILIGGGLSEAEDLLLSPLKEKMRAIGIPAYIEKVRLALAKFKNDAGILGAASLVFMHHSNS